VLRPDTGNLDSWVTRDGEPTKIRYSPPSISHDRRVDEFAGGSPRRDSRPHSHNIKVTHGDGSVTPIHRHEIDGTLTFDSGVRVRVGGDGAYIFE
jgi:hypothetical protein